MGNVTVFENGVSSEITMEEYYSRDAAKKAAIEALNLVTITCDKGLGRVKFPSDFDTSKAKIAQRPTTSTVFIITDGKYTAEVCTWAAAGCYGYGSGHWSSMGYDIPELKEDFGKYKGEKEFSIEGLEFKPLKINKLVEKLFGTRS